MNDRRYELYELLARLESMRRAYHFRKWKARGPIADPYRGQGRVLALLTLQDEISQSDLAYLLGMRSQSLGELLVKLEKSGYVTRKTSDSDKRVTLVGLTEEGKKAAADVTKYIDKYALFDSLDPEEQETLYQLLSRVAEAIERELGEGGYSHQQSEGEDPGGEYHNARHRQRQELLEKMRAQHGEYFRRIVESEPVIGARDLVRDLKRDIDREFARGRKYWAEVRFGSNYDEDDDDTFEDTEVSDIGENITPPEPDAPPAPPEPDAPTDE
jgi:DNA-binding MarR family transcriptional regulator